MADVPDINALKEGAVAMKSIADNTETAATSFEKLYKYATETSESSEKVANGFSKAKETISQIPNVLQTIQRYSEQISNNFGSMMNDLGKNKSFENLSNDTTKFGGSLIGVISKIQAAGVEVIKFNDSFSGFLRGEKADGWANISEQFEFVKNNIKSIEGAFGKGIPGLSQIGSALGNITTAMTQQHKYAQNANAMQREIMQMAAAQGQLNDVIGETGGKIDTLPDRMLKLSDQFAKGANANALTVKEYSSLAKTLIDKIPGALNETFTVMDSKAQGGRRGITQLDAAIKIAVGSGRAYSVVVKDMEKAFEDLNANAEVASKYSAAIGASNQSLGLIMEHTNKFFDSFIEHLRDTGLSASAQERAIVGASNVLGRYSQSLRDTGLSAKSSTELIKKLTDSIMGTSIAEKSFLSARSGGVGGLQGGFKIEKMIKEGRTDEVVNMAEKNLRRQFGGKVYTLDDASKSSEAASQFYKQREMLKSGAFGIGKGLSDDQASRFLESLASGKGGKGLDDLNKTLNNTVNVGNQIQEKQLSELTILSNTASNIESIVSVIAQRNVQKNFAPNDTYASIENQRELSAKIANERKKNNFEKSVDIDKQLKKHQEEAFVEIARSGQGLSRVAGNIKSNIKEVINPIVNIAGENNKYESAVNEQMNRGKKNIQNIKMPLGEKPRLSNQINEDIKNNYNPNAIDKKDKMDINMNLTLIDEATGEEIKFKPGSVRVDYRGDEFNKVLANASGTK